MSQSKIITPRTLKGFRDYLPEAAGPREALLAIARKVYRSFGFRPIDTPALEYTEILLGKGGDDAEAYAKEVIRSDFEEPGDEDVFRKIRADFDEAEIDQSDHQIRRTMDELLQTAMEQVMKEA